MRSMNPPPICSDATVVLALIEVCCIDRFYDCDLTRVRADAITGAVVVTLELLFADDRFDESRSVVRLSLHFLYIA